MAGWGAPLGCECEDTDIGATLVALAAGQDPIAKILFCSLVGWKDLDDELRYAVIDSGGGGEGLQHAYSVGVSSSPPRAMITSARMGGRRKIWRGMVSFLIDANMQARILIVLGEILSWGVGVGGRGRCGGG